jgi:hypothetical protein
MGFGRIDYSLDTHLFIQRFPESPLSGVAAVLETLFFPVLGYPGVVLGLQTD